MPDVCAVSLGLLWHVGHVGHVVAFCGAWCHDKADKLGIVCRGHVLKGYEMEGSGAWHCISDQVLD